MTYGGKRILVEGFAVIIQFCSGKKLLIQVNRLPNSLWFV